MRPGCAVQPGRVRTGFFIFSTDDGSPSPALLMAALLEGRQLRGSKVRACKDQIVRGARRAD